MSSITLPGAAGGETIQVDIESLPDHIKTALILHGMQQKVADSVANAKANDWSQDDCKARCLAVIESLKAGTWAARATGPRARTEDDFVLNRLVATIKAKAKAKKSEVSDADAKDRATNAMKSTNPDVIRLVESLRAEYRAARAKADAADLI